MDLRRTDVSRAGCRPPRAGSWSGPGAGAAADGAGEPASTWAERALVDRLNRLQVVLPALADDVATARREAARLRVENRRLAEALADLERRQAGGSSERPRSADGERR